MSADAVYCTRKRKAELKEIVEQQNKDSQDNLKKQVVKVVKSRESLVRDAADKKVCDNHRAEGNASDNKSRQGKRRTESCQR